MASPLMKGLSKNVSVSIDDQQRKSNNAENKLILVLKTVMVTGLSLILLGIYFHMYSDAIHAMGVTGMVISACCVAIGMIMSLPTKMYLTFVLVKREDDLKQAKRNSANTGPEKH